MKCIYCNEVIILHPSAEERAKKYGGKPSDYTKLFRYHAECHIKQRELGTQSLVQRMRNE